MALADAKKDIAFVRKEKKEDDLIVKKLEEVYGKSASVRDNGYRRSKEGWECPSCGYVNFESRLACGECLDAHPAVVAGTQFAKKNGGANRATSSAASVTSSEDLANASSVVTSSTTEQILKRLPNIKQTGVSFDNYTKILQISDRCYRMADFPSAAVALGKKKAIRAAAATNAATTTAAAPFQRGPHGDEGDDGEDGAGDDGFESCSDGEDGPSGGCGGPGMMPSHAGEALDDYGDSDDDDYDVYAGNNKDSGSAHIRKLDGGEYEGRIYVSPLFYGYIIGKHGSVLTETQRVTNTIIKVPKGTLSSPTCSSSAALPSEEETIVIRGPDRASVTAAIVKIESIVMENRARAGYSHFLSIPLGKDKQFQSSAEAVLTSMKSKLCNATADAIDDSLFQDASWLHFTILTLRLHTQRELQLAKRLLQTEVKKAAMDIFGSTSNSRIITLRGVQIMNDDPKEVNVLFTAPQSEDEAARRLFTFIDAIGDIFAKNDLCSRADAARGTKLHATLMNSKFRKGSEDEKKSAVTSANGATQYSTRIPFDATKVLEMFSNSVFGDYALHTLELSRMNEANSETDRKRMTYYGCEDSIEF